MSDYPDYVNWIHSLMASSLYLNTTTRTIDRISTPHIKTKDGPMMSVQAGPSIVCCSPKTLTGPYNKMEAMIWAVSGGRLPEYLKEYDNIDGVLTYVPVELLNRFIHENGGIDYDYRQAQDTETQFSMRAKHK